MKRTKERQTVDPAGVKNGMQLVLTDEATRRAAKKKSATNRMAKVKTPPLAWGRK